MHRHRRHQRNRSNLLLWRALLASVGAALLLWAWWMIVDEMWATPVAIAVNLEHGAHLGDLAGLFAAPLGALLGLLALAPACVHDPRAAHGSACPHRGHRARRVRADRSRSYAFAQVRTR